EAGGKLVVDLVCGPSGIQGALAGMCSRAWWQTTKLTSNRGGEPIPLAFAIALRLCQQHIHSRDRVESRFNDRNQRFEVLGGERATRLVVPLLRGFRPRVLQILQ